MKQTKLLFGFAIFLAAGISACSDDTPAPDTGEVAQKDEILYMRVAISQPSEASSRVENTSTNFEDGVGNENEVKTLYFKFYDTNGAPVSTKPVSDYTFVTATTDQKYPSVGKVKEAIVSLGLNKGDTYPAYVMCFINPVNFDEVNAESDTNMSDLRDKKRDNYKGANGNFAMNNSVYYGEDIVSGAQQVKISGTPIKPNQIYSSYDEADKATAAIDIFVERYAAKVKFTIAEGAVQGYELDGYTLTFTPEAWTINADAPEMYAVKRFATTAPTAAGESTQPIPTYTQVQTMLGAWNTWNDEPLHRSYWSCSPSYYATAFPQVSDNIADKAGSNKTGAGEIIESTNYKLRYYSYNQVMGNKSYTGPGLGVKKFADYTPEGETDAITPHKYTLENTMGKSAFESVNPKAAAPSVLVVGNYTLKNGENSITAGTKFYIYQDEIYFDASIPENAAEGAETMLNAFLDANQILAIDQNGTLLNSTNAVSNSLTNFFSVKHPDPAVRGDIAVPHRYVTLQLNTTSLTETTPLFYKPNGSNNWVRVTNAIKNQINTLLWQQLANAQAYTNGKAYFSIPIAHIGLSENSSNETTSPITDNKIDWSKVRVGDFGLVRNHVYTLTVSKIQGLGTGIENLDYPIVPPMEMDDYYIKYRINILNWRIVPEQKNIIL